MMFNLGFQKKLMSLTIIALVIICSTSTKDYSYKSYSKGINNNLVVLNKVDMDYTNLGQFQNESPNRNKARAIALKWATINKSEMKYKPFQVKTSGENISGWKSYLVLLSGEKEKYLLKKVCFSSDNATFGFVLNSNDSCKSEVIILLKKDVPNRNKK